MSDIYTIWSEGYSATGERQPATLHGDVEADSFEEACGKVRGVDLNEDGTLRLHGGRPAIWACQMFDNEADARRGFG